LRNVGQVGKLFNGDAPAQRYTSDDLELAEPFQTCEKLVLRRSYESTTHIHVPKEVCAGGVYLRVLPVGI
jgi:hypothetical protein